MPASRHPRGVRANAAASSALNASAATVAVVRDGDHRPSFLREHIREQTAGVTNIWIRVFSPDQVKLS
jgi:hypothetical protein